MSLPLDPEVKDIPPAIREALRSWGRLSMTPGQQREVINWIVSDLCECLTVVPPGDAATVAYTNGQRRVGIVLSKLTGLTFRLKLPEGTE